jgi:hypothetical protein
VNHKDHALDSETKSADVIIYFMRLILILTADIGVHGLLQKIHSPMSISVCWSKRGGVQR